MNQNATYSATNVIKSATCLQNIKKTIWYNRTKEQDLRLENSDYTVTSRRSITMVASTSQQYYQRQQDISSGVLGGIRGYTAYTNLWVFLTAYTHLSPFATPVCVYPPPFLARHRWIYRHHNEIITPDAQVVESTR